MRTLCLVSSISWASCLPLSYCVRHHSQWELADSADYEPSFIDNTWLTLVDDWFCAKFNRFCLQLCRPFAQFVGYLISSKHWLRSWPNFWQWVHLDWGPTFDLVVADTLRAVTSTPTFASISLLIFYCLSSLSTMEYTLFRFGNGSRGRMLDLTIPNWFWSSPIRNLWTFSASWNLLKLKSFKHVQVGICSYAP